MSKPSSLAARQTSTNNGETAKVALGATRKYWTMRCDKTRKVSTLKVAPVGTLFARPALSGQKEESIKSNEVSAETLSQNLESSQCEDEDGEGLRGDFTTEMWNHGRNVSDLSGEQKAVLNLVVNKGKNVFFTGAAGTGKSVLLRCMISQLYRKYGRSSVAVTASTGIAACNIGGQTIHRFAGFGLGTGTVDECLKMIKSNRLSYARWKQTNVLLIDEVSMVDSELLEKLEEIARKIRGNNIPFGGIQIVCTGDLFQLPPVTRARSHKNFCFESLVWDRIIERTVNLTQIFRQSDPKFIKVLNEMRLGTVSRETETLFDQLVRVPKLSKGIVPTQLFPKREEVANANSTALKRIVGTEYVYDSCDWKSNLPGSELNFDKNFMAESCVKLKIGAQVMLIKNLDNTLVNGSIGRVVAFMSQKASYVDYGSNDGDSSSHYRSRAVEGSASKEASKSEVVGNLLGAYGDSASSNRKRMLAEDITLEDAQRNAVLPVVKFVTPQNTIRFLLVQPETWEITNADDMVVASRTQLPLILAWALSIHKAQGQTLPYVSVNLRNIFEDGQAYVAISRAISVEGLQVLNFSRNKVRANGRVIQYYDRLEEIQEYEIKEAELSLQDMHQSVKTLKYEKQLLLEREETYVDQPPCVTKQIDKADTHVNATSNFEHSMAPDVGETYSKDIPGLGDDDCLLFSEPDHHTYDYISHTLCNELNPNPKRVKVSNQDRVSAF